jgi:hypothetical protein
MAAQRPAPDPDAAARAARLRASNVRTAIVLATIALVFFAGVIASKYMGGYDTGMAVVGFGIFLFLAFAIGRNLRKGRSSE